MSPLTLAASVLATVTGASSGVAVTAVNGVAAYYVDVITAGTYTFTVTSPGLTSTTTTAFTVTPAAASQLVIQTQPSATATAGVAFAAQPVIYEEDKYGNLETGDNSTVVTATLGSGAGPLQGATTATVHGGIATFTNLADDKAETISLKFMSGMLTTPNTSGVAVSAATASSFTLSALPATVMAGTAFNFTVTACDAYGNVATGYTGTVHFTSSDGAANLPANDTFTSGNAGVNSFTATLNTAGAQTITATDTVTSSITGNGSLTVSTGSATSSVSFLKEDTTTEGNWINTYGSQGYEVIGNATSLPSYATVTPKGQSTYTWASSTTDPRLSRTPAALAVSPPPGIPNQLHRRRRHHRRQYPQPRALLPRLGQHRPQRDRTDHQSLQRHRAQYPDRLFVPLRRLPRLRRQRQHPHHHHQNRRIQRRPQRIVLRHPIGNQVDPYHHLGQSGEYRLRHSPERHPA